MMWNSRVWGLTAALVLAACLPGVASAAEPRQDDEVEAAISKAITWLLSEQTGDGSWGGDKFYGDRYEVGPTALVVYALLEANIAPTDPRMDKALTWLSRQKTNLTYELGLRCNVWHAANRRSRDKYKDLLKADALALIHGHWRGSYHYEMHETTRGSSRGKDRDKDWDNSNSQYGLYGIWAAWANNVEVPSAYWQAVMGHWLRTQNADGGWGYKPNHRPHSQVAMATAGLASMFVAFDAIYADRFTQCGRRDDIAELQRIKRGLDWMEKEFPGSVSRNKPHFYYLFGVERVGLAAGYKYFGTSDWYKEGKDALLATQRSEGSWKTNGDASGNDHTATAYALLFLIRGRNPVLFNKLQYAGDWNNRPRDLASLTSWISRRVERPVNWQIVNLRVPVREWHDAPILYIAGSTAPQFSDEDLAKLRTYVEQGGTIFSVTECNGQAFSREIRKVYAEKLFPEYEMRKLGPQHPIYSIQYDLRGRPQFEEISNGIRPLVIHCETDLPLSWQTRRETTGANAYEAAFNAYMIITDKGALRSRGVEHWPTPANFRPERTIQVARVKHDGDWNPEPKALERFALLMGNRHQVQVDVLEPVELKALGNLKAPLAIMTGTAQINLSADDLDAIKAYTAGGGTLLIDAAGGKGRFYDSVISGLQQAYGPFAVQSLTPNQPPLKLPDMEIDTVKFRHQTMGSSGTPRPRLRAIFDADRNPRIILSREDLTVGLLDVPVYKLDGYDGESAFRIVRNIALHAAQSGRAK